MPQPAYYGLVRTTGLYKLEYLPTGFAVPPHYAKIQNFWFLSAGARATYIALLMVDDPTGTYTTTDLTF